VSALPLNIFSELTIPVDIEEQSQYILLMVTEGKKSMKKPEYNSRIILRMPQELVDLLESTAHKFMLTRSEYVRKSLMAQLLKDGVPLDVSR